MRLLSAYKILILPAEILDDPNTWNSDSKAHQEFNASIMKIHKDLRIQLILIFLFLSPCLFAQQKNPYSVSGKVLDGVDQQSIEYASVAVLSLPDSVLKTGAVTGVGGSFQIPQLSQGRYVLKMDFIGYKTQHKEFEISDASVRFTDPILMYPTSLSLGQVEITASSIEKQISIERTKIDVSKSLTSVSGNLLDILKNQAGVQIDANQTLYLRGNKNILLLIDGVPSTLASIQAIPANQVESIEIVSNPDARYDAEGTGGIIHIITRQKGQSGWSGVASLGYGTTKRATGGTSINYNKGKINFGFSYSGKHEQEDIKSELSRHLIAQEVFMQQKILSMQTQSVHSAGLNLSIRPNKRNFMMMNVRFLAPDLQNIQNIEGEIIRGFSAAEVFERRNETRFSRRNVEGVLSYKRVFEPQVHELNFDLAFSRTRGRRPAQYFIQEELFQKSTGGGAPTNMFFQADYLKQVRGAGRMEIGLKAMSKWNSFNYYFYDYDNEMDQWIENPLFSNDLEHQEYIHSAYFMYSDSLFRNLYYKVGARMEYNTSELIQKSLDDRIFREDVFPFPYMLLKYSIRRNQSIALSVNRRITRPTYPQINPFVNIIDHITHETGNKNLEPEILDKFETSYSWLMETVQIRTALFYSLGTNYITQVSLMPQADRLMITYVNGSKQYKTGMEADLGFRLNRMISINPAFSFFKSNSTGLYQHVDLKTNDFSWTGSLKTSLKPDSKTEIQVLFNYNAPLDLPQFTIAQIYYADISARRSFMKNKLLLTLSFNDVFNTRKWSVLTENDVYSLQNLSKSPTRMFWIGLSYNFNSFKARQGRNTEQEKDAGLIKLGQ